MTVSSGKTGGEMKSPVDSNKGHYRRCDRSEVAEMEKGVGSDGERIRVRDRGYW